MPGEHMEPPMLGCMAATSATALAGSGRVDPVELPRRICCRCLYARICGMSGTHDGLLEAASSVTPCCISPRDLCAIATRSWSYVSQV